MDLQMNSKESSRPPFPLTDEQVIRKALMTVTRYAETFPDESFYLDECVDWTMGSIKDVWKAARGYSSHQALTREDQDEIVELFVRIGPDLRERAVEKAMECLRNRKVQKLNQTTAEAIISNELRRRGLPFHVDWQKLRAKVSIKLECGRALTFFVKYKDIEEGKLLPMLDEVFAVVEPLDKTKVHLTVSPLSGAMKNWAGWTV